MDVNIVTVNAPHSAPANVMSCQNCGREIDGDENYCPECGASVKDHDDMKKENTNSTNIHRANGVQDVVATTNVSREGTTSRLESKQTSGTQSANMDERAIQESATLAENIIVDETVAPIILTEKFADGYRRAKFLVTTVDRPNRNSRIYSRKLAEREVANLKVGEVLGRDGHPTGSYKFTENFLIFEKMILEGDYEYAVAKVVPTMPDGSNFLLLADAGANATCSRRGKGSLKETTINGKKVGIVQDDYQLIAIDVLNPNEQSDPNARLKILEWVEEQSETNMPDTEQPNAVVPAAESETTTLAEQQANLVAEAPVVEPAKVEESKPKAETTKPKTGVEEIAALLPTEIIESLTQEIQDKDRQVSLQAVKLNELAGKVAVQNEQIETMNETFETLNQEVSRLSKLVNNLNNTVQERSKTIAERDATLQKRNQTLAERQKLLEAAHATVAERDVTIAERNRTIAQRNALLAARDRTIAERDAELQERNETIVKQDGVVAERDAAIAERDQTIATERKSLMERDAIIAERDAEVVERNQQILALNEAVLAEQLNVTEEKKRNAAFRHLFDKVQVEGDKASWFIFNALLECKSPEEVEERFEDAKARGIALIEGIATRAGKAVLQDVPTDDAPEVKKDIQNQKSPEKNRPTLDATQAKQAKSVARLGGL